MQIYVAGTVLRPQLESHVHRVLQKLYAEIETVAREHGHSAALPYPEDALDLLPRELFRIEILSRIDRSDAVISVHYPCNEMVAFEAQYAAKIGKPLIIVVDRLGAATLPRPLTRFGHYPVEHAPVEQIIAHLEQAAKEEGGEAPPMATM